MKRCTNNMFINNPDTCQEEVINGCEDCKDYKHICFICNEPIDNIIYDSIKILNKNIDKFESVHLKCYGDKIRGKNPVIIFEDNMVSLEQISIYKHLINKYGEEFQCNKTIEECGELIVALSHKLQNRLSDDDVLKEVADVQICLEALKIVLNNNKKYNQIFNDKITRIKQREVLF